MAKNIVIGGAGFLGSHLVDRLTGGGESVVVVDNLTTGRLSNLEDAITLGRATFVYADVRNHTGELSDIVGSTGMKKVDVIYTFVPPDAPQPTADPHREAVDPVLRPLIEMAVDRKARLVVSTAPKPDAAEREMELALAAAVCDRGLDARIVRLPNCYGPRARNGDPLIAALLEAAVQRRALPLEHAEQASEAFYVADAVSCLRKVARRDQSRLPSVEIVNGDERSVTEIARMVARTAGLDFDAHYPAGRPELPQRRASEQRATCAASPVTPLEHGLRYTYDWLVNQDQLFV
ncbi:MAG: NAD-dependent epimerase/dehydratase family protein [Candidatus Velthaea sp.]|jgi:nucleoside-diphosphate-sugar epimerase